MAADGDRDASAGGSPDSLFFKLVRVVNLTARPFQQRVGRQHQRTLSEWRVMAVIGRQPGCTATQVVARTGLDKMAVSRSLAGLQRAGRLQRREDPTDQRRRRLHLTAAGKDLFSTVRALGRRREAELFAGLGAEELARFSATLDKLAAAVEDGADGPGRG